MTSRANVRLLLAALSPVWLIAAAVTCWLRFEVVPPDALGHHVRETLRAPEVRDELSRRIARAVAVEDPRAAATEPLIRSAAALVIESRQFADAMDIAAQLARRAVLEGRAADASRLADLESQLLSTVERLDPDLARRIPRGWDTRIVDLRPSAPLARSVRLATTVAKGWAVLVALTIAWHLAWIGTASRRRATLGYAGLSASVAGLGMMLAARVVRSVATGSVNGAGARRAVGASFDIATRGLRSISLAVLVSGLLVTAATTSGTALAPAVQRVANTLGRLARAPRRTFPRVIWAVGLGIVGIAAVVAAPRLGPILVTVAGLALAFGAVTVLGRSLPDAANASATGPRRYRLALYGVAVLIAPAVLLVVSRQSGAAGDAELRCNGWAELCDRRVDEVTFAATHNSMASADAGFLKAPQTGTIDDQLRGGIRGLLVDTHYGIPTAAGIVWSDLSDAEVRELEEENGEDAVADALRLRSSILPPIGAPTVYLCHHFCELGATPAVDAFRTVRRFLEENPSEVVVVIVQDETDPSDTIQAMRDAGLDEFAYAHVSDEPWPTLGELVRAATPLIVLAENHGGNAAWFHPAFDLVTDTPYDARAIEQLSCARNRGQDGGSLLLLNAWVNSDLPSIEAARQVNRKEFLVDLAQTCRRERDHVVNFVAVNFWREGQLLEAVETINRSTS